MSEPPNRCADQPAEPPDEATNLASDQPDAEAIGDAEVSAIEVETIAVLLTQTPPVRMPAEIADRIHQAITAEARRAAQADAVETETEAAGEAAKRVALGSFGKNPATERKDLSPEARHRVAAVNRARHLGLN